MNDEVRQGLGLAAVAVVFALLSLPSDFRLFPIAALLLGIGGAVLVAKGLLKPAPAKQGEATEGQQRDARHPAYYVAMVAAVVGFIVWGIVHIVSNGSNEVTGISYLPANPYTLTVRWTIQGEPDDSPDCAVEASDSSGRYQGQDSTVFSLATAQRDVQMDVHISNDGAAYVTEVTVEC